jgi:pimeloyl-ACP methyl ester carboxylesterase
VGDYADFVMAYIQKMKLNRVRLIGHSFGGRISIYLSAHYPEVVRQIVLADSAGVRPEQSMNMRLYYSGRRVMFTLLKIPGLRRFERPLRDWLRQKFGSTDYLNAGPLEETFKLVINEDLVPIAREIQAPTLLIWGEQDKDTPLRDAKILEDAIPDAGLVVFEGAGHYAYLERPTEFARIVSHFFKS